MAWGSVNVPGGSTQGTDGKSAYEIAVQNGYTGSVTEWLASLKGKDGKNGKDGDAGRKGDTGLSAYELAVQNGYTGSVTDWLASLKGTKGDKGDPGSKGDPGAIGPAGPGLPTGGTAGQVPVKVDGVNYNTQWKNLRVADIAGAAPTSYPDFTGSISMGRKTDSEKGTYSIAVGSDVTASELYSCAQGHNTQATARCAHAEGQGTTASGQGSHSEGWYTTASYTCAHAEGTSTEASGAYSHAEGRNCKATGASSHAGGEETIAAGECQTVIGKYNVESNTDTDRFIVGKGSFITRSNCFRVTDTGVYATGAHNTTGADYAEMFEWTDGNPNKQDRCGYFAALVGDKIRLAGSEDDFILGIVSGDPSVVGDVHDDQWQGMYLYDIFGRPLWEDVDVPAVTEEVEMPVELSTGYGDTKSALKETRIIIPAHTERRQKLNPNYNPGQKYIPRSQRPEWSAVGMMGKLVLIDDGICEVNGWAKPTTGGIGTKSETQTKFRVMARLDDTHVRVLIL